jgi:hypothetical protein
MKIRVCPRYINYSEAQFFMELGAQLTCVSNGFLSYSLLEGHLLPSDNLHQLAIHHSANIFVEEQDSRSDEQVAVDAASTAHRMKQIFANSDFSDQAIARCLTRS